MRLDIYMAETARIAQEQVSQLDEARESLLADRPLNRLEQGGALHALQVLVENAIGKAKHTVRDAREPVPVSAYDAFATLVRLGRLANESLDQWNAVVGIRNRIVRDYMNVDMSLVLGLVRDGRYQFVADFLLQPIDLNPAPPE